jgi:hypothetical protein
MGNLRLRTTEGNPKMNEYSISASTVKLRDILLPRMNRRAPIPPGASPLELGRKREHQGLLLGAPGEHHADGKAFCIPKQGHRHRWLPREIGDGRERNEREGALCSLIDELDAASAFQPSAA